MDLNLNRSQSILLLLGAALLFIGIRIYLIDSYAVMTPYWDDWGMGKFLSQSVTTGVTFSDFYKDANEHRLMFNRVLSLLLFNANQQQWDPMVSMLANAVIWSISGIFLMRLALKYQHQINAPLFIGLILFLWSFPFAFVNIIWGIQTHTYTMIFFSLMGCWYSGYKSFSLKWWLGIVSLGAAGLTLAGGTFAAFSVLGVQLLLLLSGAGQKREALTTLIASLLMGLFGLTLILAQKSGVTSGREFDLANNAISFFSTLSWPIAREVWPAFIFMAPVLILIIQSVRAKSVDQPLVRFTLCLYGFIVIVALAISYARGYSGVGPARRYFEFLALSSVASFMALLLIQNVRTALSLSLFNIITVSWIAAFIYAIPWNSYVFDFSVKEYQKLRPIQTKLVKSYLNTGDRRWLEHKPYEHVPYPAADKMDDILDELSRSDVLPYRLQTPDVIRRNPHSTRSEVTASPFVKNGTLKMSTSESGITPYEETVYGSYKPANGGMSATGAFSSEVVELKRPYVAVSVTGYFGYPEMSMQLINEVSGEKIELEVQDISSKYAEFWREILVEVPRGYYRLVAEDNNPDLWFGFSTPRTVGRLSYWTQRLLENSFWFWRIAVLFILCGLAKPITTLFNRSIKENNLS